MKHSNYLRYLHQNRIKRIEPATFQGLNSLEKLFATNYLIFKSS
jgi:hypothetical protein